MVSGAIGGTEIIMKKDYDLIVLGGGLTGVAAAVSASREGLDVLLIEKSGFLGGAISNCYVNPFMQYRIGTKDGGKLVINRGIFLQILNELESMGGLFNANVFNQEYMKLILDRLTKKEGVDVLFHTYLTKANTKNGKIESVTVDTRNGEMIFCAKYFIDASGDANLAFKAGFSYNIGREGDNMCQPMTLCFEMSNVDIEKFYENRPRMQELYKQYQKEGKIKNPREDILVFKNIAKGVLHFNSTRVIAKSTLDAKEMSKAEMTAREQVFELYNFLKTNCPGCEDADLLISAPEIGVRESRMIKGDYTLTADDLINCTKFEDSVAVGVYGIDVHSPDGSGTKRVFIREFDYYTIPYRSLLPDKADNMLVAGRCISSTHEAQSAYRVLPIVCNIGEAAGLAISVLCKENKDIRSLDIDKLHKLMEKYDLMYK